MGAAEVFEAIQRGDLDGLRELVSRDPASAASRNAEGVSVLVLARYARRMDMVRVLLAAAPQLDVFEAAMLGEMEALQKILRVDSGAARAWSVDGFSALHLAASFGPTDSVEVLLAAGADPGAVSRNPMRLTPLHAAVTAGRQDVARSLLERGADANAVQVGGFTPLHAACRRGDAPLVELLLSFAADPECRSDDGRNAADFAAESGHPAIAERLRGRAPRADIPPSA